MNRTTKFSRFINAMVMICSIIFSLLITSCGDDNEELKPTLSETELVMKVGETAKVFVNNASTIKAVADSEIVTVTVSGNVAEITAVSSGQTTVYVSANGYSLECEVTVESDTPEELKPTLSETELVMKVGETAKVFFNNASTIKAVADSEIVTVTVSGNVAEITAVSSGQTTVYVSANGYSLECEVTVESDTPEDSGGSSETPDEPSVSVDEFDIITSLEKDEMVFVKGGTFLMGAQSADASAPNFDNDAYSEESPVHSVTLSDFYIGKYEVTQQLWEYVMKYWGITADGSMMGAYSDVWLDTNPSWSYGLGNYYPAYYVSWYDIVDIFIPRLNKITGKTFRLPTEAEWEYAARGGNKSKGYIYSGSNLTGDVAWYSNNSSHWTHQVGTKAPNELGIYDMSGNVWEWCSDRYSSSYYSSSPTSNPTGPISGSYRVRRGGSCYDSVNCCRVAYRGSGTPVGRYDKVGFRLVLLK